MENENFYMSLPSNSSTEYFQDNKVNNFITKLPQCIELSGNWEVGLVDFQFPVNWLNLKSPDGRILVKMYDDDHQPVGLKRVTLSEGYYPNAGALVRILNSILNSNLLSARVNFSFDEYTNKISITTNKAVVVVSDWLREMMGFDDATLNSLSSPGEVRDDEYSLSEREAPWPVDMKRGINSLYIYTDVIQDRIVGHTLVPLLRAIPAEGRRGNIASVEMFRVHYLPVQKKSFHTIQIYITDDTGTLVPFQSGRSVVTLHFRRSGVLSVWGLCHITNRHATIAIIISNKWVMVFICLFMAVLEYREGLGWAIYFRDCGELLFLY